MGDACLSAAPFAIAALQLADNSALSSVMQARRAWRLSMTAAHNLCASLMHAARRAWGGGDATSVLDIIASIKTTENSAKAPVPTTDFAMISPY